MPLGARGLIRRARVAHSWGTTLPSAKRVTVPRSLCSRSFWDGDLECVQQSADELVGADQMEHVDDPAGSEQFRRFVVE